MDQKYPDQKKRKKKPLAHDLPSRKTLSKSDGNWRKSKDSDIRVLLYLLENKRLRLFSKRGPS